MMNQRARMAGAMNSNFRNPNGLPDPGQFSTARDLSLIARAAYANSDDPLDCFACRRRSFVFPMAAREELENTNKVLRRLPYCNGMKTGYTDAAGSCLISSAARPGRDVIAVVLGAHQAANLAGFGGTSDLGSLAELRPSPAAACRERSFPRATPGAARAIAASQAARDRHRAGAGSADRRESSWSIFRRMIISVWRTIRFCAKRPPRRSRSSASARARRG